MLVHFRHRLYRYPTGVRSASVLQVPVIELVATTTEASSLPTATALSCLPYWLEAAGWAVGLRSDAVAAGMGRLPATERKDAESTSDLLVGASAEG